MRYSPYTISPQQHDVIDAHVKEMSDEYIIEPSTSGWVFPDVLDPKMTNDIKILRRLQEIKPRY